MTEPPLPHASANSVNPVHSVRSSAFAFSLVEVVLALGVISFAIVGIMGLFPVAMRAGLESQRETRANHIARMIFSDLAASPPTNAMVATGPDSFTNLVLSNFSGSLTNLYDNAGLPTRDPAAAAFAAKISIRPDTPATGLAHIEAVISAPAAAPETNRSAYTFVTLLRQ